MGSLCEQNAATRNLLKAMEQHRLEYGNCFHNNNWRQKFQKEVLIRLYGLEEDDVTINPVGNTGPDFKCPPLRIFNGEMKGRWLDALSLTPTSLGLASFDKQDDPLRRKQTLLYDSLMYSLFTRDGDLAVTLLVFGDSNMAGIRDIMREKQREFVKWYAERSKNDKRVWDTIDVPVLDAIKSVDDNKRGVVLELFGHRVSKDYLLEVVENKTKVTEIHEDLQ